MVAEYYRIVTAASAERLEDKVDDIISLGEWTPVGSPSCTVDGPRNVWLQAVVRCPPPAKA